MELQAASLGVLVYQLIFSRGMLVQLEPVVSAFAALLTKQGSYFLLLFPLLVVTTILLSHAF